MEYECSISKKHAHMFDNIGKKGSYDYTIEDMQEVVVTRDFNTTRSNSKL